MRLRKQTGSKLKQIRTIYSITSGKKGCWFFVTVGEQNEAILTIEGNVFAKGINIDPNNPNKFINISSLIEDTNDRIIEDIISGARSIYLLTSNQNVYGIGSNVDGQLGLYSKTLSKTEKPILMMKNISKIFSGNSSHHVFLLNSNQELFGCGYNKSFQLGIKRTYSYKIEKLTKIQNIPKGKIIDIQSGWAYSIMLIENEDEDPKRKLYLCGGSTSSVGKNPQIPGIKLIETKDNIREFSVGNGHALILTTNGEMLGFGSFVHGQQGYDHQAQSIPIKDELPKLMDDVSNYHISCGFSRSFLYYSPPSFSNLEEDLIKLFRRKEFCDISFKTKNGEIIEAHKLILKYRLKDENQIEKLQEIISNRSIKDSNQIFEMIYSNRIINPKLYSEIKEIINSNEKIEETMKRIYLNENENDFIIERKEKQYKFPKLILIMRSELYRGMFLSVTEDKSNKVTDYSELSNKSFQIFEYWIYSNQIKEEIEITQEIINEIKIGIDYFQLNQTNPTIEYLKENDSNQNLEKIQIENIQKVTVGEQNEAILTIEGNVFAKGKYINPNNPHEFINISSLIEDTNDRIIQDIGSGAHSIYLLTSNQNAYGIGDNDFSQLGFDSKTFKVTQKPILMMKNVSKIFSGNTSNHVFLLNSNQELFGCGYNEYHQLGLGELRKERKIEKLTKIQNIPKGKIIDIQCGYSHSIMLIEIENEDENKRRKLYSCGSSRFNGLGKFENTYEFTEIKSSLFENDNILDFSVGNFHNLILTYNSKLIGFGDNFYGQLGTEDTKDQYSPIQIELPELRFNEDICSYHISCGAFKTFLYYSPPSFSNLEEDLIKLFERKEFCNISFKTENGEIIEAHKLILKYRLNQNEIEKLQEIISNRSIKESNQIFEMIYSNSSKINPKLYSEIKEIINSNEKIEETMKRIYLNENENEKDFIIERKEKQYKFPKLILIMRSELYRGMFLSVTEDKSNKVTDYSELSNKSFQIFEYWIYSNQIKNEIQITQEIIEELERGIDYFQLNQTNPNLFDLLIKFNKFKIKIKIKIKIKN
ncbi:regulator of chromosome condensation [Anaeramoeba ignava]|uniref:Regulator of chromosome condensation n=1 Tax=Anaeramoeba ignava TaxID=1746090 RepID=A0A9Q0LA00_ANAIG|nr:regulator of chromosome condensation [Anaeramoeba ignava]